MYLNLDEVEYHDHIYRIIPYDRFIELFDTKKNTLVKTKKWEDTFENLALKSKLKFPDGSQVELDTHERLYGQCWTTSKASDAMWRIYSPDKRSVRIRTTVDKLLTSLIMANVNTSMTQECIGKVEYLPESEIVNRAKKAFTSNGQITFSSLFRSLLHKRKAFEHEKEIRLAYLDWGYEVPQSDIFQYEIDPHKLITQVMIDPRVSYVDFLDIQNDIRKKTGYQGDIKRSLLYRLPETVTVEVEQNITSQSARTQQSCTAV
ncbi:DUF2971 domain-containing protein [Plesiomonas shigelloides]|uniref:DUF2971 domain-containing protein n=1 Tax=Plesiomonas shigelloides TaxID=703 RepID=UPI001C5A94F7|nr:DUF2971 domain-containing protein [Plesiomonas shigelloides]MBW3794595.1 DUF2971 domain-containing protein [Plesiomonas shigelloides]